MKFKNLTKAISNAEDYQLENLKDYKIQLKDKLNRLHSFIQDYIYNIELDYDVNNGKYYYENDDVDHYSTLEIDFEYEILYLIGKIDIESDIKEYNTDESEEIKTIYAKLTAFIWDEYENEYIEIYKYK